MSSRRIFFTQSLLMLLAIGAIPLFAQDPRNPGIFQKYSAPPSSTLGFLASEGGKQLLLHSPSPVALQLLSRFHPDAVSQYPQEPLLKAGPNKVVLPAATVTGCGTASGTRMNLEPATNAVTQKEPSVDFLLSEIGSGLDLVVEHGTDNRGLTGFDSLTAVYVHRDATVPCYGGTDFEMGNPTIPNPFLSADLLPGVGGARVLADPSTSHKQFILADLRMDALTSGVGLRRVPASHFETVGTCPAGTLNQTQAATCAGSTAIIVDASLDDMADSASIAQDQRASGAGAGDIYVVNTSFGRFGSVIHLTACKATFTSNADCSTPIIVSGIQNQTQFPSIAVVLGGPNIGMITITYGDSPNNLEFLTCTPHGAPAPPSCGQASLVKSDPNMIETFASLTGNPGVEMNTWPVIANRTDTSGQTTFIVWHSCKMSPFTFPFSGQCPDADVVMATATNLVTPTWTIRPILGGVWDEIMPAIAYDTGQNVITIANFRTVSDVYKNRIVLYMNQILSGSTTLTSSVAVTSSYDSIEGDGYFTGFGNPLGDYIGLAAHGGSASGASRIYFGFTNNSRQGTYSGTNNNQADNNVSRATY